MSERRHAGASGQFCLRGGLAAKLALMLTLAAFAARAESSGSAAGGPSHVRASPALDLRLEAGLVGRAFRYTDPVSQHDPALAGQRPPDNVSPASPLLRLRVESFPLAALTPGWPGQLGLHVDVSGAFPTRVRGTADQVVTGTQSQGQLLLGVQGRMAVAGLELVPRASWGLHGWYSRFDEGFEPPFPDLTYQFFEFGLRARGTVGALSLEGDFAVRPGLSAGALASAEWFPATSFYGVTTGVSTGWAFGSSVSVRARLEFAQYGLAFHPPATAPAERRVGGATDRSVLATLGFEWRLPGVSGPPRR